MVVPKLLYPLSAHAIDYIMRIVTYKRYSVGRTRRVKVLLTTTVGLCTLVLIPLPSAYIHLTTVRLFVAALARRQYVYV